MKGQCVGFHLVPTLFVYGELKLRYGLFTMYSCNSICITGCHGNGKISYSPNEFFS